MKKKSTSKLAFFSLRVLPGLVAAAFTAFALASSYAACDCITPTQTAYLLSSDGHTLLRTDIYRKDWTPRPVLVQRGWGATTCVTTCIWPANADYHLVVQRGRGTDFLYSDDRADGHTLIDYINAGYLLSDGHIVMSGGSNSGIADYLAAPGADAHLHGILPSFATGDLLNYGLFNGGALHRDTVVGPYNTPWKDYVALPDWDKYLITDYDAGLANIAGIHRSGWFDIFSQGALDSFSRLQTAVGPSRNRQKVVIGPWIHGANGSETPPPGRLPFPNAIDPKVQDYNTAWQNGMFHDNWAAWNALPVAWVYHMGAPLGTEWRSYTTWPPPAIEYYSYFASGGNLSSTLPLTSGEVAFTSNPDDPCPTLGGTNNLLSCVQGGTCGPYDQRAIELTRSDLVKFTSNTSGAWIVGRIHADVWIKTDLPDVDVFVRMTDVYPDAQQNKSILMAQGIQRALYRNGACPEPLVPNQPTKIRVDLWSTALVIPVGHKLRVIVSASAGASIGSPQGTPPLYEINPQNGDEYIGGHPNRTGSIKVLFGGDYGSALVIPVPTGQTLPPDERPPKPTPCPQ
jgi:predicted acyl esterase